MLNQGSLNGMMTATAADASTRRRTAARAAGSTSTRRQTAAETVGEHFDVAANSCQSRWEHFDAAANCCQDRRGALRRGGKLLPRPSRGTSTRRQTAAKAAGSTSTRRHTAFGLRLRGLNTNMFKQKISAYEY